MVFGLYIKDAFCIFLLAIFMLCIKQFINNLLQLILHHLRMHLIFCHSITMSLLEENMLRSLLLPGTIIDVIVPLSKSAQTS